MNEQSAELSHIEATPMTLIQQALSKDVDPERLEKLMALQERWTELKAKQAFNEAMNQAEQEMPTVIKDRQNSHTRSTYATLDAVLSTIKPVYSRHGFSMSFNESECSVPDSIKVSATVRHVGGHSEEFSAIVPLDNAGVKGVANKTGIQSKGSSLTYCRRYLTLMIWSIALADEDTDGNSEYATLTEEQVFYLQGLVDQCEDAGDPLHRQRFFSMFNLPADAELGDITQAKYEAAKNGLQMKLQKAKKAVVS